MSGNSSIHPEVLIHNVRVVDENSDFHLQAVDILIKEGIVVNIEKSITVDDEVTKINGNGCCISIGWCDIGALCGEPGDEVHETVQSLCMTARTGGYTTIGLFSNQARPFDNRHIVSDIQHRSCCGVSVLPIATVTKALEGQELTEMLEIADTNSPLFTDGLYRKYDNAVLCKAMEYALQCGGTILTIPGAARTLKKGQVNESGVSAQMGLPGLAGYEEVATLAAELSLMSYSSAPYFAHMLSHRESIDHIKYRKEQGCTVFASVSALHLTHTEEAVADFDQNFKVLPPLRSESDRQALIAGLKEGVIDIIVSNHNPISSEQKEREFGESPFGATGLETSFLSLVGAIPDMTATEVSNWLGINPRKAMGAPTDAFKTGVQADFTLFSLDGRTTYKASQSHSLSRNSPYNEEHFHGQIIGTISGNQVYLSK